MDKEIYGYITAQENSFKTERVPITSSKDWNMSEHIERCTNVANGWFHTGKNDGLRPYDDLVTPIVDVAFRSEGFDVKDIVPYVNKVSQSYKSFLVKKFHPQWARKNKLDTFIDEVVETSIIYDLVLVKNVNETRPEVIKLPSLAFCDQTDVLAGSIGIKHNYSVSQINKFRGVWKADKIDEAIVMAKESKDVSQAEDQEAKTTGKNIEVYEVHGNFPETWLDDGTDSNNYINQLHIVAFYTDSKGGKNGITLYSGKSKPLDKIFKALKIDQVRSHGRACGRSIVERMFEPQVWSNYSAIKLKKMLDSAVNLLQTDSEEYGNQKLSGLKEGTILKHEPGKPITRVDGNLQNVTAVQNFQNDQRNSARMLGSASEAQLGVNPTSGTPFALQNAIIQQGEGIHEYRQGKIATFFADELYPDWILKELVKEMNSGKEFSEELTLEEMQETAKLISKKVSGDRRKEMVLQGKVIEEGEKEQIEQLFIQAFMEGGTRKFFEVIKDELKDIPMDVFINIKGKQRYMAQNADKITNIIREVIRNPQAFTQIPGIGKAFNQLMEESGLSPIDFTPIISAVQQQPVEGSAFQEKGGLSKEVAGEQLVTNQK